MISTEDFYKEYEFLPIEAIIYFSELNPLENGKRIPRKIVDFCSYYQEKYKTEEIPQPQVVAFLCDKLAENNHLSITNKGGYFNMDNSYICVLHDKTVIENPILFKLKNILLSFEIYGFKLIYDYYQNYVLPILNIDENDNQSIGSCFHFFGGILTAKHCIEKAKKIAIKGIEGKKLEEANFYTFHKESMDLVFIKFQNEISDSIFFDSEVNILEEVIALGYPQIPGFHNFLTAEKATISARFTGSKGNVASIAEDIWMKENLILITAKIKGGNSGGPIINNKGRVIGIASNLPTGEGKYDDLGYGTVIPIKFGKEIINSLSSELNMKNIEFIEFVE